MTAWRYDDLPCALALARHQRRLNTALGDGHGSSNSRRLQWFDRQSFPPVDAFALFSYVQIAPGTNFSGSRPDSEAQLPTHAPADADDADMAAIRLNQTTLDRYGFYLSHRTIEPARVCAGNPHWGIHLIAGGVEALARDLFMPRYTAEEALPLAILLVLTHEYEHMAFDAFASALDHMQLSLSATPVPSIWESVVKSPLAEKLEALANAGAIAALASVDSKAAQRAANWMSNQPAGYSAFAKYPVGSAAEEDALDELLDFANANWMPSPILMLRSVRQWLGPAWSGVYLVENSDSAVASGQVRWP